MDDVIDVLTSLADDAGRTALKEFSKQSVSRFLAPRLARKKTADDKLAAVVSEILNGMEHDRFRRQVAESAVWARTVHVQGMSGPVDTAATTIGLGMTHIARRFRRRGHPDDVLAEAELRQGCSAVLLLGDPGSGKTTALKRLTLSMFDEIPSGPGDDLAFPVVIVCREVDWSSTDLSNVLAARFGVDLTRVRSQLDLSSSEDLVLVAALADQTNCLIILDGLDEVGGDYRNGLVASAERLQRLLGSSRIVCSSRSGSAPHLDGWLTLELLPLDREQRNEIARRRLDDNGEFWTEVDKSGIDQRILDRPLFLNHVIRVFEATTVVPDRPSVLYTELVRLMVHEWDEQRRVAGRSEIHGLNSTTMDAILREIAFRLTQLGLSVFTDLDLRDVLSEIGQSFELNTSDSKRVLREIEAQSGFIVESASGFEFSHSTLQEHLCAQYVVLRPNHNSIERLLRHQPEIAAVAVALSSSPTDWILERITTRTFDTSNQLSQFVDRLGQERPRFRTTSELGERLLQLMTKAKPAEADSWLRLSGVDAATDSVMRELRKYNVSRRGAQVELAIRRDRDEADQRRIARHRVPASIFDLFARSWAAEGTA